MKTVRWMSAAVAVALLSLTGCTLPTPNSAAQVGTTAISVAELDRTTTAVAGVLGAVADELRPSVLTALIQNELARQIAVQAGVTVDPAGRAALFAGSEGLAALAKTPGTAEFANGVADVQAVLNAVGGNDAFIQAAARVPVNVNPRFGTWDAASLAPAGLGSISQPYAAASTEPANR